MRNFWKIANSDDSGVLKEVTKATIDLKSVLSETVEWQI